MCPVFAFYVITDGPCMYAIRILYATPCAPALIHVPSMSALHVPCTHPMACHMQYLLGLDSVCAFTARLITPNSTPFSPCQAILTRGTPFFGTQNELDHEWRP